MVELWDDFPNFKTFYIKSRNIYAYSGTSTDKSIYNGSTS